MGKVRFSEWNGEKIAARAREILEDFGPQVAFQAEQEIAKDQYYWPRFTRRKSGQLVEPGDRNIVDTGELLNSATAPAVGQGAKGPQLVIQWMAPYSGAVLTGGYLIGTTRNAYIAPPRNWIAKTFDQLQPNGERPFLPYLVRRWQQMAGGR